MAQNNTQNPLESNQSTKGSLFRLYCVGIVALNKKFHENTIEFTPVENVPHLDGELNDQWEEVTAQGTDAERKPYDSNVKFTKTLNAVWLPMHQSNRMTAPDVRRGEKVLIYQFGNSQNFFWDTLDNYTKVRRLEAAVYGYCATKEENVEMNADNTYVQGVSTAEKIITLISTTKKNEEKYKYQIFIDTKNYHIVIRDDYENRIVLQTEKELIRLETKDCKTLLQLDKGRITSKGTWFHQGDFSVKQGGVYENNVQLSTHRHPETQKVTLPPTKSGQPWNPHPDKLDIDYRQPELFK